MANIPRFPRQQVNDDDVSQRTAKKQKVEKPETKKQTAEVRRTERRIGKKKLGRKRTKRVAKGSLGGSCEDGDVVQDFRLWSDDD